jgi:predicted nucleic acid-binding protein
MLSLARRFDQSAYDAAYLTLAETRQEPLITVDLDQRNAVRDHLDWVSLVSEV